MFVVLISTTYFLWAIGTQNKKWRIVGIFQKLSLTVSLAYNQSSECFIDKSKAQLGVHSIREFWKFPIIVVHDKIVIGDEYYENLHPYRTCGEFYYAAIVHQGM